MVRLLCYLLCGFSSLKNGGGSCPVPPLNLWMRVPNINLISLIILQNSQCSNFSISVSVVDEKIKVLVDCRDLCNRVIDGLCAPCSCPDQISRRDCERGTGRCPDTVPGVSETLCRWVGGEPQFGMVQPCKTERCL